MPFFCTTQQNDYQSNAAELVARLQFASLEVELLLSHLAQTFTASPTSKRPEDVVHKTSLTSFVHLMEQHDLHSVILRSVCIMLELLPLIMQSHDHEVAGAMSLVRVVPISELINQTTESGSQDEFFLSPHVLQLIVVVAREQPLGRHLLSMPDFLPRLLTLLLDLHHQAPASNAVLLGVCDVLFMIIDGRLAPDCNPFGSCSRQLTAGHVLECTMRALTSITPVKGYWQVFRVWRYLCIHRVEATLSVWTAVAGIVVQGLRRYPSEPKVQQHGIAVLYLLSGHLQLSRRLARDDGLSTALHSSADSAVINNREVQVYTAGLIGRLARHASTLWSTYSLRLLAEGGTAALLRIMDTFEGCPMVQACAITSLQRLFVSPWTGRWMVTPSVVARSALVLRQTLARHQRVQCVRQVTLNTLQSLLERASAKRSLGTARFSFGRTSLSR